MDLDSEYEDYRYRLLRYPRMIRDDTCTMVNETQQTLYSQYEQQLKKVKQQHHSKQLQQCEDYLISQYGEQCYLKQSIKDISSINQGSKSYRLWEKSPYKLCFHHILFSPNNGSNLQDITQLKDEYTFFDSFLSYMHVCYKGLSPSECIDCIDITWSQYPYLQHYIKYTYLNELLTLDDPSHTEFICNNIGYIVSVYQKGIEEEFKIFVSEPCLTGMFLLLKCSILCDYEEGVTLVISILHTYQNWDTIECVLMDYVLRSDTNQLCSTMDKFMEVFGQYDPKLKVSFIYHCCSKFTRRDRKEGLLFIMKHKDFILSFSKLQIIYSETLEKYFALLLFLATLTDQPIVEETIKLKLNQEINEFTDIMNVFEHLLKLFKEDQHISYLPNISKVIDVLIFSPIQHYSKLQVLLMHCQIMHHNLNEQYVDLLHHHREFLLSMAAEILSQGTCREKALYCEVVLCLLCHFNKTNQPDNSKRCVYALYKVKEGLSDHEKYCYTDCIQGLPIYRIYRISTENSSREKTTRERFKLFLAKYITGQLSFKQCLMHLCNPYSNKFTFNTSELMELIKLQDIKHGLLSIVEAVWEKDKQGTFKTESEQGTFKTESAFTNIITRYFTLKELMMEKRDVMSDILPNVQNGLYLYVTTHYAERQLDLVKCILELNMTDKKTDVLYNLTLELGKLLPWEKIIHIDFKDEYKRIIYQCICIIRRAKKINNKIQIDPEKYVKFFNFIHAIDIEVEKDIRLRRASFMVMLVLLLINLTSGPHLTTGKLKKYLSLKYEYDKLILYLLWCSGDVEINPGPTLKRLRKLHNSEKERNWITEIAPILVKLLKGIPENSKPKSLWNNKPDGWPDDIPFYDPNNKSKMHNDDDKSDENLLNCLTDLCQKKLVDIPATYKVEITLWKDNKNLELFEIYLCRKEAEKINIALAQLQMNQDSEAIKSILKQFGTELNLTELKQTQCSARQKSKGETNTLAKRDFAGILCKIIHRFNPEDKCDGIWKKPPNDWPPHWPFFSPNNESGRRVKSQDLVGYEKLGKSHHTNEGGKMRKSQDTDLLDHFLEFCADQEIGIPTKYQDMVEAWKNRDMKGFCKIYVIQTNAAKIEHSLKYLKIESLIFKPFVLNSLKQIGLIIDTEWWKSHNGDSQDSSLTQNSSPLHCKDTSQCSQDINHCQSDDQKRSKAKVNQPSKSLDSPPFQSSLARQSANLTALAIQSKSSISPEIEDIIQNLKADDKNCTDPEITSLIKQNLPGDNNQPTDEEIVSLVLSFSDESSAPDISQNLPANANQPIDKGSVTLKQSLSIYLSTQNLPADKNQLSDPEIVSRVLSLSDDSSASDIILNHPASTDSDSDDYQSSKPITKIKKRPHQDEDKQPTKRQKLISNEKARDEQSKNSQQLIEVLTGEEQIQKLLDLPLLSFMDLPLQQIQRLLDLPPPPM